MPQASQRLGWMVVLGGLLLGLLAGCAAPKPQAMLTPPVQTSWDPPTQAGWQMLALPGKTPTVYQLDAQAPAGAGRKLIALRAEAQSAASMLRATVRVEPEALGQLHFSWLVPELIPNADMAHRDTDDSPVRLILAFEGDRSKFSAKDAMLNELARLVTGEEMPYATLIYAWCNLRPVGSVIPSARTDRVRALIVESGAGGLQQWQSYERDIRADYVHAFGEAPGPLVAIGLMTDTDNTRTNTVAWYGPIALR